MLPQNAEIYCGSGSMTALVTNIRTRWSWSSAMTFIRLPLALTGSGIAILVYKFSGRFVCRELLDQRSFKLSKPISYNKLH